MVIPQCIALTSAVHPIHACFCSNCSRPDMLKVRCCSVQRALDRQQQHRKGCEPPPLQGAALSTLLYWYSGEKTVLKERGKNKWLEARSQRNFFNWLFPCIQHILSTLSRGAELEMANSSQACNALTGQTCIFLQKSLHTLMYIRSLF